MTYAKTVFTMVLVIVTALSSSAGELTRGVRPIDERTLHGTYVFAARVLLNPSVAPQVQQNPPRVLIDCFSIGELRFDGRGGVKRRVEIRCPTTPNLLAAGLGVPASTTEPTPSELAIIGSTLTAQGTYDLKPDGWGQFADRGAFRLGPVPGNPTTGAGRVAVTRIRGGVAQEIAVLLDHQSLQPPGVMVLVNSDIGNAFVATRR